MVVWWITKEKELLNIFGNLKRDWFVTIFVSQNENYHKTEFENKNEVRFLQDF